MTLGYELLSRCRLSTVCEVVFSVIYVFSISSPEPFGYFFDGCILPWALLIASYDHSFLGVIDNHTRHKFAESLFLWTIFTR